MFTLKKRRNIWHYYFCVDGKVYRGTTKTTNKQLAEKHALDSYNKVYQNTPNTANEKSVITDVIDKHIEYSRNGLSPEWLKNKIYLLRKFTAFATGYNVTTIDAVSTEVIELYKLHLFKTNSPAGVQNNITVIKTLLNFAVKHGYINKNPAASLERIHGIKKNKQRYFSNEEVKVILDALSGHYLRDLVITGLYTGMRRRELIFLEHKDMDIKHMNIHVRNKEEFGFMTKSRKERVVPLHKNIAHIFAAGKEGYCFAVNGKRIHEDTATRNFKSELVKLGICDAGLHTLRHTFVSHCLMLGKNIWEVSRWVGHSTSHITELYGHLCPNRREIDSLGYE